MRIILVAILLLLLPPITAREAYITLLYGRDYLLPLRVMMRSLHQNTADNRERIVITTATPPSTLHQLHSDNLTILPLPPLPNPYTHSTKFRHRFTHVLSKLYIFNLTTYTRLLFLDADSLILTDISPLFTCGTFCATFINPCYFNTGLMHVTPNHTLFHHMTNKLSSTPSYDGGDQGFLNSYYPQMLSAPFFNPNQTPPQARLPFSYHVDHSAYYPASEFTFTPYCGKPRIIEWLGPTAAKPWLWWTYAVFDLSWTWYEYRRQLHNAYPPGSARRDGVLLVAACYVVVLYFGLLCKRPKLVFVRFLVRTCPLKGVKHHVSLLYAVLAGVAMWLVLFGLCFAAVPKVLTPYFAVVVWVHLRFAADLALLVFGGVWLCVGQKGGGGGRDLGGLMREIGIWAGVDAVFWVVWDVVYWMVGGGMWRRGGVVLGGVVGQVVGVAWMVCRVWRGWFEVGGGKVFVIE